MKACARLNFPHNRVDVKQFYHISECSTLQSSNHDLFFLIWPNFILCALLVFASCWAEIANTFVWKNTLWLIQHSSSYPRILNHKLDWKFESVQCAIHVRWIFKGGYKVLSFVILFSECITTLDCAGAGPLTDLCAWDDGRFDFVTLKTSLCYVLHIVHPVST